MKKLIVMIVFILPVFIFSACKDKNTVNVADKSVPKEISVAGLSPIKLVSPDFSRTPTLMNALKSRKSERNLSDKMISIENLSGMLWAACGINRPDGKRTVPAAYDKHAVDVYVVLSEGVYLYDPVNAVLNPVAVGDFRKQAGMQDFVYKVPVNLVYVADLDKYKDLPSYASKVTEQDLMSWAYIEAGCQSQNVSLYCSSEGLGSTVRVSINRDDFGKTINIRTNQRIILAHSIGFPK